MNSSRDQSAVPAAPFQIRSHAFPAIVLALTGPGDEVFFNALEAKLNQAPHFFQNAPFVIDLDKAVGLNRSGDFTGFVRELRARRITAIGVQNGTVEQNTAALTAGLITLKGGRELSLDRENRGADEAEPEEAERRRTLLITEPVRSGQQVFADQGDLIVIAAVSSGAELIADGNIHVYGSLRGRALAGVNGDATARIFCQSLEAELIAIAGLYKTSDDLDSSAWRQRIQAFLMDDTLCVEPLK